MCGLVGNEGLTIGESTVPVRFEIEQLPRSFEAIHLSNNRRGRKEREECKKSEDFGLERNLG